MAEISACPACDAAPLARRIAASNAQAEHEIALSLPGIHCAACITGVEDLLASRPGVASARVNLTRKEARVQAEAHVHADDLIAALTARGYEARALDGALLTTASNDRAARDLLMRLAVAGFAMMNVMLLSVAVWSGAEGPTRDMFHWISAMIALPAVAFSGMPFFTSAWAALRGGRLNMEVPISLALALAVATSLWETALSGEHAYFDAAVALTFFLLAGRYLDHRTRALARSAAETLSALESQRAIRITPDGPVELPLAEIAPGDHILVRPGMRVPVDGEIVEGSTDLDRGLLTGESLPVPAAPGDKVSAGEVTLTGALTIRATAIGRESTLARMADLVAVAEAGRSNYTPLADAAARLYAPGVHILAGLSFVGWMIHAGDVRQALNIAAAVLIITCPCALGLAVPAVTTAATGRLFRRGLLVKSATALERLAEVDTVVFDKTGTLTSGDPTPDAPLTAGPEASAVALALAEGSAHPLARGLAQALRAAGIAPARLTDRREIPGRGVEAMWRGRPVRLGRADWVGAAPSDRTATYLALGERKVTFDFTDSLRPGAAATVAALQAAGLRVLLLSGDTAPAVQALAGTLGIREAEAGVTPDEKLARIRALAEEGAKVLMVGDGLNDTAALAAAHVSASPASAMDAARVASDIVMLGEGLDALPEALALSRRAVKRIRGNFRIATLYNVLAVPLAVIGLATPLIAALAMSASSITVSLNALRLGPGKTGAEQ